MKRGVFSLLTFLAATLNFYIVNSQKEFTDQRHTWITYTGNHKLTKKIGVHTEYQWRRHDWFKMWQQSLLRLGVDYQVNSQLALTLGYGWILTFPYGDQSVLNEFNEHRIWQQINLKSNVENSLRAIEFQHRYRLEQRLLETFYSNVEGITQKGSPVFRHRIRYRAMVLMPINKKTMQDNTLFLNMNDEVFIGFGEGIGKNVFDQNRFNISLGWRFNRNFNWQVGYLNQYLIKTDGIKTERNHTLLTAVVYNFESVKK